MSEHDMVVLSLIYELEKYDKTQRRDNGTQHTTVHVDTLMNKLRSMDFFAGRSDDDLLRFLNEHIKNLISFECIRATQGASRKKPYISVTLTDYGTTFCEQG